MMHMCAPMFVSLYLVSAVPVRYNCDVGNGRQVLPVSGRVDWGTVQ